MVTITINNSLSRITGLTPVQEKSLKAELSYVVGGSSSFYSGFGPKRRSLLDKHGSFPTGLLYRVVMWTKNVTGKVNITDARNRPNTYLPFELSSSIQPYHSQKEAVHAAVSLSRGIISMPTGSGKSLVIAMIAARLGLKTLVVVPSLEIKKQLMADLLGALNDTSLITVENIDSRRLQKLTGFDVLIIDEAHHVAAKTYQKLNIKAWTGIYYRFFLTATPFRNDLEDMMLFEAIAGKVIYKLTYADAVAKGSIVPVESYYIEIPKQDTDAYTWSQVYNQLVVNHTQRNVIIASLLLKLQLNQQSTLCLVKEVAHGKILEDLTGLPFVSGADDESRDYIRQFKNGELRVLIGTEGILGEGVDTKPCEFVVIAGLGKAKSSFMQKVGRTVRRYHGKESGKVILVKDASHKFCLRHFNAQKKILREEYNSIPMKLEL